MKCPYCGNEMDKGTIQSPHEIAWVEGEKRLHSTFYGLYDGAMVLSKRSMLKGSAVIAFLCRECQKVLIDYSDEHSDLNAR